MMKNYIFSALLSSLCLTSCITAKCPGYDLNDFQLISFRLGDTLTYVSNQLDTIHLIVTDFYSKGYYEFSSYPDYECDLDIYYRTDIKDDISIKEHITYGMSVQFCNDNEYKITSGNYTKKDDCKMEVSDTVVNDISCKKYLVKDLSFNRRINIFVKVDFCGITEFQDKVTGLTWVQIR
ncbi:MAG: hypothetical protein LBS50_05970 [Prevotellaceae bacterium]|nr:hypothetical protein [Prevotellaceae bacterium]